MNLYKTALLREYFSNPKTLYRVSISDQREKFYPHTNSNLLHCQFLLSALVMRLYLASSLELDRHELR